MRIATSPAQQAWLSRQAIWWRGDGDPRSTGMGRLPRTWNQAVQTIVQSGHHLGRTGLETAPE